MGSANSVSLENHFKRQFRVQNIAPKKSQQLLTLKMDSELDLELELYIDKS